MKNNAMTGFALHRPLQAPVLEQQQSGYRYREYLPNFKLASFVACFWTLEVDSGVNRQLHRILPDGCVDLIVNGKAPNFRSAAFFTGLMTDFDVMTISGPQFSFGIRLFAGTAEPFMGQPPGQLQDSHVYVEDIWGTEGLLLAEKLLSAASDSVYRMIAIAEEWMLRILAKVELSAGTSGSASLLVQESLMTLYDRNGMISMEELAAELAFTERHVRRAFHDVLGISPKSLTEIIRFQSVLRKMTRSPHTPLVELAHMFGYYDQSHFIKSFKRFYGLPPGGIGLAETCPFFPIPDRRQKVE
ncbi:AraC family transcriptional regulator [Paenibacillus sp. CAU 1782]